MSFTMDEVSNLPTSKDWAAEGKVNPIIPNQGGCGVESANSNTAMVEEGSTTMQQAQIIEEVTILVVVSLS